MTIGKKFSPVLDEIEQALWEWEHYRPNDRPEYTIEGFRGAIKIFMSVLLDRMYQYQDENNLPIDWRCKMAEKAGQEVRSLIAEYTGIDSHDLYKTKIDD